MLSPRGRGAENSEETSQTCTRSAVRIAARLIKLILFTPRICAKLVVLVHLLYPFNMLSQITGSRSKTMMNMTKRKVARGKQRVSFFSKADPVGLLFVRYILTLLREPITWFLKLTITAIPELKFSNSKVGPNIWSPISFTNGFGYMSVVKFVPGINFRLPCTFESWHSRVALSGTGRQGYRGHPGEKSAWLCEGR